MDDLIYKQDAINLLKKWADGYSYIEHETELAIKAFEQLPPAKTDGIPLEWIDKHLEWLDNCDNDFAQLAKVGIRAMVEIWKKDKT